MLRTFKLLPLVLVLLPSLSWSQLTVVSELPREVEESSGLAFMQGQLFTHNDSGNRDILYGLDPDKGQLTIKLFPEDVYNEDWEDLAIGSDGTLYIADIGNNDFSRKTLKVYGLKLTDQQVQTSTVTTIRFPEEYCSKKGKIRFDIEALVHIEGKFYLFTKTYRNKFKDYTEVFEVNAVSGQQLARYCGKIPLCGKEKNCKITGAAFEHSSGQLALLSHKNLWLIEDFDPDRLDKISLRRYEFDDESQKEGVTFRDQNNLSISDERNKGEQRLFLLQIR